MRRVLVIGCSGAGKTTFARKLAGKTGLPFVPLDRAYWQPGWVEPARERWRETVAQLAAAPAWIMDGNYAGTFDIRMPRADTIVWFDYSRAVCLRRALTRSILGYGRVRADMGPGCPEKLDPSFFRYIWNFRAQHRPLIEKGIAQYGGHASLSRVTGDAAADAVLARVEAA